LAPPFPPSRRSDFLFASFSFGGGFT